MTRLAQKQQEQAYLKHYLKNKLALTPYSILEVSRERPDFVIEIQGKKVGIEVTCLYKSSGSHPYSERCQIAKRIDVISRAQKIYSKNKSENFHYHFNFDLNFPIESNKKLAKKLAKSLEQKMDKGDLTNLFKLEHCPEIKSVYCNFEQY